MYAMSVVEFGLIVAAVSVVAGVPVNNRFNLTELRNAHLRFAFFEVK